MYSLYLKSLIFIAIYKPKISIRNSSAVKTILITLLFSVENSNKTMHHPLVPLDIFIKIYPPEQRGGWGEASQKCEVS